MSSATIGNTPRTRGSSSDSKSADAPAIRLLTLNAHQGFSARGRRNVLLQIRDGLRAAGADLVFLQEIGGLDGPEVPAHQYEILADQVWTQHAYGRNAVSTGGHHGNALLSKYPIMSWQNIDVSVDENVEARGILHCVLDIPHMLHPLHAVCLHFGLRESHRQRQLERLLELAGAIPNDAPLVIAGDFNDWREHAHRRLLRHSALQEIHAGATGRPARTFPARWPWLPLDRIYVRNLRHRPLQLPRHPWATLSDHAPLAGEVRA